MDENNLTIVPIEEMPVTDKPKKKRKEKPKVNCLQDIVIEFMDEFKLKDADMVKGTNTPWATWHGWITGDVSSQLADNNLLSLWMFINKYKKMSLQYLLYGIGSDEEDEKEAS